MQNYQLFTQNSIITFAYLMYLLNLYQIRTYIIINNSIRKEPTEIIVNIHWLTKSKVKVSL